MKKQLTILSLLLVLSFGAIGQDTSKKDTVTVPVYIYEKSDTAQVDVLLYMGANKVVMYERGGYVIVRGQATVVEDPKTKKKEMRWVNQPVPVGALLSDRKTKVNPIL